MINIKLVYNFKNQNKEKNSKCILTMIFNENNYIEFYSNENDDSIAQLKVTKLLFGKIDYVFGKKIKQKRNFQ